MSHTSKSYVDLHYYLVNEYGLIAILWSRWLLINLRYYSASPRYTCPSRDLSNPNSILCPFPRPVRAHLVIFTVLFCSLWLSLVFGTVSGVCSGVRLHLGGVLRGSTPSLVPVQHSAPFVQVRVLFCAICSCSRLELLLTPHSSSVVRLSLCFCDLWVWLQQVTGPVALQELRLSILRVALFLTYPLLWLLAFTVFVCYSGL